MKMFRSEDELLRALDANDDLIAQCVRGEIGWESFEELYGAFYWEAALHGQESDDHERALFEKHGVRIELHRRVAETVLAKVCSAEDAAKDTYVEAGRIGPKQAVRLLKDLAREFLGCEP